MTGGNEMPGQETAAATQFQHETSASPDGGEQLEDPGSTGVGVEPEAEVVHERKVSAVVGSAHALILTPGHPPHAFALHWGWRWAEDDVNAILEVRFGRSKIDRHPPKEIARIGRSWWGGVGPEPGRAHLTPVTNGAGEDGSSLLEGRCAWGS
jgi:hypothetical protein